MGMETDYEYVVETCKQYYLQTGYLAFEIETENEEQVKAFESTRIVSERIKESGFGRNYGQHICANHICVDILVFDKKRFKKLLRDFAPVFMRYNAKWVECTPEGLAIWKLDFKPEIIEIIPAKKPEYLS